jgi:hypothetical protein
MEIQILCPEILSKAKQVQLVETLSEVTLSDIVVHTELEILVISIRPRNGYAITCDILPDIHQKINNLIQDHILPNQPLIIEDYSDFAYHAR